MDIGRAFNFSIRDQKWVIKTLLGAVMILIPILGWFSLAGYGMRIMRRVVEGTDAALPEWTDYGQLFVDGLKALIIGLIWAVPSIILNAIADSTDSFGLQCLGWLAGVATFALVGAAIVPVALSGNMADGLRFREILRRVSSRFGDYAIIFLFSLVLSLIVGVGLIVSIFVMGLPFVGLIVGIIGIICVIAIMVYFHFASSHLWAQAYRRSTGAEELEPAPRF